MSRVMCYRCFWPQPLCWCKSIHSMDTSTHFVFLMHPKEFKQEKAATGRLTHLCLPNSRIIMDASFERNAEVAELLAAPERHCVLLYPGATAHNLSITPWPEGRLAGRTLTVLLLDATWACARKMLRLSPNLQALPRVMFTAKTTRSRYVIKQQPQEGCLSTLEATHELLLALEEAGLDRYSDKKQLLDLFGRMQEYQIRCASDPNRQGYRRHAYKPPAERAPNRGESAKRRQNYIPTEAVPEAPGTARE